MDGVLLGCWLDGGLYLFGPVLDWQFPGLVLVIDPVGVGDLLLNSFIVDVLFLFLLLDLLLGLLLSFLLLHLAFGHIVYSTS